AVQPLDVTGVRPAAFPEIECLDHGPLVGGCAKSTQIGLRALGRHRSTGNDRPPGCPRGPSLWSAGALLVRTTLAHRWQVGQVVVPGRLLLARQYGAQVSVPLLRQLATPGHRG